VSQLAALLLLLLLLLLALALLLLLLALLLLLLLLLLLVSHPARSTCTWKQPITTAKPMGGGPPSIATLLLGAPRASRYCS
jgi:hypothetical protein